MYLNGTGSEREGKRRKTGGRGKKGIGGEVEQNGGGEGRKEEIEAGGGNLAPTAISKSRRL